MKKTSKQLCKNRQNGEKSEGRLTDDRNYVWCVFVQYKFLFVLPGGQFKTGPHCHQKARENKGAGLCDSNRKYGG